MLTNKYSSWVTTMNNVNELPLDILVELAADANAAGRNVEINKWGYPECERELVFEEVQDWLLEKSTYGFGTCSYMFDLDQFDNF